MSSDVSRATATQPLARWVRASAFLPLLVLALLVSACQSYQPKPIDLDAAKRERQARSLDDAGFQRYLHQLDRIRGAAEDRSDSRFSSENGIALWEAEAICLYFSPELRRARIAAGVPLAEAEEAGRLTNPTLGFDLKRILENVANPWIVGANIGFSFPFSNRRELEREALFAEHGVAMAEVLQAEWQRVAQLRGLWVDYSVLHQRQAATDKVIAEVRELSEVADALREAGALSVVDARAFAIELATLENEVADRQDAITDLRTQILTLMGMVPEAELEFVPEIPVDDLVPEQAQRLAQIEARSPRLAKLQAAHKAAERALELEIEKQYPDFGIGGGVEREGENTKAGLGFSIPLPFFDLNQQAIAKAAAQREASAAAYAAAWEDQVNALAVAEQQHALAIARADRVRGSIGPILDRQLSDLQRLAELGQIDALLTLDVLVRRYDLRQRVITAQADALRATTQISVLCGPPALELAPQGSLRKRNEPAESASDDE